MKMEVKDFENAEQIAKKLAEELQVGEYSRTYVNYDSSFMRVKKDGS